MIKSAVISQYLKKVEAKMPDGLGKALLEEHLHLEPVLSPSAVSHTYDWKIDNFKNWHENQPKKVTTSQFITTGTENQSVHFKMWLLSNGLDPLTGRVNLTLHLQYASKKFLKLVPVEVLISVIDENGVKRHTQGRDSGLCTSQPTICYHCFSSLFRIHHVSHLHSTKPHGGSLLLPNP